MPNIFLNSGITSPSPFQACSSLSGTSRSCSLIRFWSSNCLSQTITIPLKTNNYTSCFFSKATRRHLFFVTTKPVHFRICRLPCSTFELLEQPLLDLQLPKRGWTHTCIIMKQSNFTCSVTCHWKIRYWVWATRCKIRAHHLCHILVAGQI